MHYRYNEKDYKKVLSPVFSGKTLKFSLEIKKDQIITVFINPDKPDDILLYEASSYYCSAEDLKFNEGFEGETNKA